MKYSIKSKKTLRRGGSPNISSNQTKKRPWYKKITNKIFRRKQPSANNSYKTNNQRKKEKQERKDKTYFGRLCNKKAKSVLEGKSKSSGIAYKVCKLFFPHMFKTQQNTLISNNVIENTTRNTSINNAIQQAAENEIRIQSENNARKQAENNARRQKAENNARKQAENNAKRQAEEAKYQAEQLAYRAARTEETARLQRISAERRREERERQAAQNANNVNKTRVAEQIDNLGLINKIGITQEKFDKTQKDTVYFVVYKKFNVTTIIDFASKIPTEIKQLLTEYDAEINKLDTRQKTYLKNLEDAMRKDFVKKQFNITRHLNKERARLKGERKDFQSDFYNTKISPIIKKYFPKK
jgi:hypothetical protein